MIRFYKEFYAYLQLNLFKIRWVFLYSLPIFLLFYIANRKGYVRIRKKVIMIISGIVFSLNCSFVFVMTLFGRAMGQAQGVELIPFKSYIIGFVQKDMEMILQIVMNIVMCIPLGFLLPYCFKLFEKYRKILLMTIVCSLSIELIQYIFKLGLFETDDIINNALGSTIGLLLYRLYCNVKVEMNLNIK